MGLHRLPARIAAVMISTIVLFVLTVGASNSWLSQALDNQARDQSLAQVRNARDNLLVQMQLTNVDYSKWETAFDAVNAEDLDWIYENIGAGASVGQVFQLAMIWGGRYVEDVGWAEDGVAEGRSGLLDAGTVGLVESQLTDIPLNTYDTVQFFAWHRGSVYALSAGRIEVVGSGRSSQLRDTDVERLLMGRRITEQAVAGIADSFLLTGLEIVHEVPQGRPSVPLLGGDGTPVAFLAWDLPQPGTTLLRGMAPALFLIVLLTAGLAAVGMALVRRNAQQLVHAEQSASSAARTDKMTGLPNRAAFNELLTSPIHSGKRSILFLDVNDFKRINDTIGHAAGDQVIVDVAQRLSKFVAAHCFLARLGGDEFAFVVTSPDAETQTKQLGLSAAQDLATPFNVMGHQLRVTLAIGYAVQIDPQMQGDDLVRQADLAMYEAKRRNCREAVAFSALIEQASSEANEIEQGLRAALISSDQLTIAYQPIIGTDGRIERAEALARWTSPELGAVSPERFIAVAEQAGLIVDLGRKLFRIVCDDLLAHPDLKVSLNVSPIELMAPDFISSLTIQLEEKSINANRIEVELTEAVIVDDLPLAAERLEELHAAGFSTALDDFGTGYSSLGYLSHLRFDTLKIDRSFVTGIQNSPKMISMISGMIIIAHGLNLQVVCEGVETAQDLNVLKGLGCDLAQGYHFDRPLPLRELIERWIRQPTGQKAA